jgi:Peptidase family M28
LSASLEAGRTFACPFKNRGLAGFGLITTEDDVDIERIELETAATFSFVPGVAWSDHRSFWRQGYRAVMITDTAFYRYRHYHAASDTPEKLAYPELARVTSGLFAAFSELARRGVD